MTRETRKQHRKSTKPKFGFFFSINKIDKSLPMLTMEKEFDLQDNSIQKEQLSSRNTAGYPHAKEWSWIFTLYHFQKLTQNRKKENLNLRAKTIKVLEENIPANIYDFGLGNSSLNMSLKSQAIKEKFDNLGFIKIIKPLHIKQYFQESGKTNHRMGKDTCKSLIRIYKISYNSITERHFS